MKAPLKSPFIDAPVAEFLVSQGSFQRWRFQESLAARTDFTNRSAQRVPHCDRSLESSGNYPNIYGKSPFFKVIFPIEHGDFP